MKSFVHISILVSFLLSSVVPLGAQTIEKKTLAPDSIFSEKELDVINLEEPEETVRLPDTVQSEREKEREKEAVKRGARWPWLTVLLLKYGYKETTLDVVQVLIEQLFWGVGAISGVWYGMTYPQSLTLSALMFGFLHVFTGKMGERVKPRFRDIVFVSILNLSVITLYGLTPLSVLFSALFIAGPMHYMYNRYLDENEWMYREIARINGEYYVRLVEIFSDRTLSMPTKEAMIDDLEDKLLDAVPEKYQSYYIRGINSFNNELPKNNNLLMLHKGSETQYLLNDSVDREFADDIDRDEVLTRSQGKVTYRELYPGIPVLFMDPGFYEYFDKTVLDNDVMTYGFTLTKGNRGIKPTYCIVPDDKNQLIKQTTLIHEVQHLVWGLLLESGLVKEINETSEERLRLFKRFRKEMCSAIVSREDILEESPEALVVTRDKKDLDFAEIERDFIGICMKVARAGGVEHEAFFHAAIASANFNELRKNCLRLVPLHTLTNDEIIRVLSDNKLLKNDTEYADKAKEFIKVSNITITPEYLKEYVAHYKQRARKMPAVPFTEGLNAQLEKDKSKKEEVKKAELPQVDRGEALEDEIVADEDTEPVKADYMQVKAPYYSKESIKDGKKIEFETPDDAKKFGKKLVSKNKAVEHRIDVLGRKFDVILEKGTGITDAAVKAAISEAVSRTKTVGGDIAKLPSTIVFSILDKSSHMFEDHIRNGFIGINKALYEIKDKKIQNLLLEVGVFHELCHEVTGKGGDTFEKEQMKRDAVYVNSLMNTLGIDIESILPILRDNFTPPIQNFIFALQSAAVSSYFDIPDFDGKFSRFSDWLDREIKDGKIIPNDKLRALARSLPISVTIFEEKYPIDHNVFSWLFDSEEYKRFKGAVKNVNNLLKTGREINFEDVQEWNKLVGKTRMPIRPMFLKKKKYGDFRSGYQWFMTWWLTGKINAYYKNGKIPRTPIRLATDAFYTVVSSHPFYDGNHRTGLLIMMYILAKSGLSVHFDQVSLSQFRIITEHDKLDKNQIYQFIKKRVHKLPGPSTSSYKSYRKNIDHITETFQRTGTSE